MSDFEALAKIAQPPNSNQILPPFSRFASSPNMDDEVFFYRQRDSLIMMDVHGMGRFIDLKVLWNETLLHGNHDSEKGKNCCEM